MTVWTFGSAGRLSMVDLEVDLQWENLDEAFADLEQECTEIVRGLTIQSWNFVLSETPQWFGRMAASWSYSLDFPVYADRSDQVPSDDGEGGEDILRKGHPAAISIANAASVLPMTSFALGDAVWFANGVDHGEGPYASIAEDGYKLRPVNRPGQMVRRALDRVQARFGDDISPAQASILKSIKAGG